MKIAMTTNPIARLLIIEDNEEVLRSLKKYFTKKNYNVVTASNGLDGLKAYEGDPTRFRPNYYRPGHAEYQRRCHYFPGQKEIS